MPNIRQLHDITDKLTVIYPGSDIPVNVQYKGAEYNGKWLRREETDGIYSQVASIVTKWDLTETIDDKEQMIPIDIESLKSVPFRLLMAIMDAIHEAQVPGNSRKKEEDSENSW